MPSWCLLGCLLGASCVPPGAFLVPSWVPSGFASQLVLKSMVLGVTLGPYHVVFLHYFTCGRKQVLGKKKGFVLVCCKSKPNYQNRVFQNRVPRGLDNCLSVSSGNINTPREEQKYKDGERPAQKRRQPTAGPSVGQARQLASQQSRRVLGKIGAS